MKVKNTTDMVMHNFVSKVTGAPTTGAGDIDDVTAMREWCLFSARKILT